MYVVVGPDGSGNLCDPKGRLAQRKSAAFTRQRPLVRTQYRPPREIAGMTVILLDLLCWAVASDSATDHKQTTNVCSTRHGVARDRPSWRGVASTRSMPGAAPLLVRRSKGGLLCSWGRPLGKVRKVRRSRGLAYLGRHCCVEGNRPHGGQVVRSNSTESRAVSGPFGALGEEDPSPSHSADRMARLNAAVPNELIEAI